MTTDDRLGVLLIGHGTRDPDGAREFLAAAEVVRAAMPGHAVEPCFLEILEPDIVHGFERLVELGARRIAVMPLLLLAAGHAKCDIPAILERLANDYPEIAVEQCPHVGSHDLLVELSELRFREAIEARPPVSADDTLLLLVARGTSDPDAIREMHAFARRRALRLPGGEVEVCFAEVADPSITTALDQARSRAKRRVVIQPHLLFGGLVMTGIRTKVQSFANQQAPETEWLLTEPLGVSELLAAAVADIVTRVQLESMNVTAAGPVEQ